MLRPGNPRSPGLSSNTAAIIKGDIMEPWCNFAGNQCSIPGVIHAPGSLDEIERVVQLATQNQQHIKAIGSGHSFSGVCLVDSGQMLLDLGPGNGGLKRRAVVPPGVLTDAWKEKTLAAVEAAVSVAEAAAWLDQKGLALSTFGAINAQTVVGAMATGTHGSNLTFGPMSNMARAFLLVDGQGRSRLVQPTQPIFRPATELRNDESGEAAWLCQALLRCDPVNDDEAVAAGLIHLGALGVIYAAIVEVEPQYTLHEVTVTQSTWEELREHWVLPATWTDARARWLAALAQGGIVAAQAKQDWLQAQAQAVSDLAQRLTTAAIPNVPGRLRTLSLTINPYATKAGDRHTCAVSLTAPASRALSFTADSALARPGINVHQVAQEILNVVTEKAASPLPAESQAIQKILAELDSGERKLNLDELVSKLLVWMVEVSPDLLPVIIDQAIQRYAGDRNGRSDQILTHGEYPVRALGIEVAVALDQLVSAVDASIRLAEMLRRGGQLLTGWIDLRFMAMTDALLGLSHRETVALVEVTMLKGTPSGEKTLCAFERQLLNQFAGIFHWGLDWDASTVRDVRNGFPNIDRFKQIINDRFDPQEIFANAYTRRLGIHQ
jgi:hypothetical protein